MNAPGWYPDPNDPSRNLYWDGRQWHRNGPPPTAAQTGTQATPRKRHTLRRLLITLAVVVGLLWLVGRCDTATETTVTEPSASPSTPAPAAPATTTRSSIPTPAYEILLNRPADRFDKANSYYVAIAPIDPSTDSFKPTVEAVLTALAAKNGGPDFSARIFDDKAAAETEVDFKTNPNGSSAAQNQARYATNERHMIAAYSGGIECSGGECRTGDSPEAYRLLWFPSATIDVPEVGQWVDEVQWKP